MTRSEFTGRLQALVTALAGGRSDAELGSIVRSLQLVGANALLSQVQLAFEQKMRGGTGTSLCQNKSKRKGGLSLGFVGGYLHAEVLQFLELSLR